MPLRVNWNRGGKIFVSEIAGFLINFHISISFVHSFIHMLHLYDRITVN